MHVLHIAELARLQLRSPLDAVVLTRATEPGNLAQPGKVLLSLAASGALRLDVAVDEKHLALLRTGLPARALADATSAGKQVSDGRCCRGSLISRR